MQACIRTRNSFWIKSIRYLAMKNFIKSVLRFYALCVTVITVVHLQNWKIWCHAELPPICQTKDCIDYVRVLNKNMNKTGQPCNDFYDYVCKGWPTQFPRPKYREGWTVGDLMEENSKRILRDLLEDNTVSTIKVFEKAKALYRTCMNSPYEPRLDPKSVMDKILQVSHQKKFFSESKPGATWNLVNDRYIQLTGETGLLNVVQIADASNDYTIIPRFRAPKSPYGMLKRYAEWQKQDVRDQYKKFLLLIVKTVTPGNKLPDNALKDIDDVLNFRDNLWQITDVLRGNLPQKMKINDLQYKFSLDPSLRKAEMDWLVLARAAYKDGKNPYGQIISGSSFIELQRFYFVKLATLLAKTPKTIIVNHMHLYFAERHVTLTPEMESILFEISVSEINIFTKIRYEKPRWLQCVQSNNMKVVTRIMYLTAKFPTSAKLNVDLLIKEVKNLLSEQIGESTWMNNNIKKFLMEKVQSTAIVNSVQDLNNIDLDASIERAFVKDPLAAEAGYVATRNRLYITAGYLQPPVYNPSYPYVLVYGGAVSIVGHELYHGFDEKGIILNKNGEKIQLPEDFLSKFKNYYNCFKRHFSKIKSSANSERSLHSLLTAPETLHEDVADSMGLKLAYKGFKNALKHYKGVCPILPGFENFSCEKLFFISFANIFCGDPSPYGHKIALLYDNHSEQAVRVNAAVSNMKEFTKAFGCQPKHPLYAESTCDLWNN